MAMPFFLKWLSTGQLSNSVGGKTLTKPQIKKTMKLHISIIEEGDLKQTWVRVSALLEHVQYAVACILIYGVFTEETTVQKWSETTNLRM